MASWKGLPLGESPRRGRQWPEPWIRVPSLLRQELIGPLLLAWSWSEAGAGASHQKPRGGNPRPEGSLSWLSLWSLG